MFCVSIHKFLSLETIREDSTILHNNNLTILVIVWEYDRNVCQNLIQIMIPYHTAVLFPSKYFLPPCIKSRQMPYHQQTGRFIFLFDTKLQIGQKLYRIWKALLFAKKIACYTFWNGNVFHSIFIHLVWLGIMECHTLDVI